MKLGRLPRLLILLAALWLPLQTVAGIGMQLCRHDATSLPAQAVEMADEHCPYHDAEQTPARQDAAQCEHCGLCHLAASGYIPAGAAASMAGPAPRIYQSQPTAQPPSHIPDTPETPPKRSA